MKKLILHILITAALFFVFDRSLGLALQQLYRQSNATDAYKISYSCESTTDSILFMGSSRCLHHFVPQVFEKELNAPCYNAADWGIKNIYFHYGLLSNILERYIPRTIVLEIHPCDWLQTPFSDIERAGSLAPYCGMSKGCDDMLRLAGKYWPYQLSTVYRYTGNFPDLMAGRWGNMDRSLKGWKPLDGQLDTTGVVAEEYPFAQDQQKQEILERFINTCQEKGIRLILTVSPMYVCSKNRPFDFVDILSARHHLPYINHYEDPDFVGHAEYFYDFGHLNRQGAERYSQKFSKELRQLLTD